MLRPPGPTLDRAAWVEVALLPDLLIRKMKINLIEETVIPPSRLLHAVAIGTTLVPKAGYRGCREAENGYYRGWVLLVRFLS